MRFLEVDRQAGEEMLARGEVEDLERYRQFLSLMRLAYLPIQLYTLAENLAFTAPWQPLLVEPITKFLGLPDGFITEADQEGFGMAFYAAILEKPAA